MVDPHPNVSVISMKFFYDVFKKFESESNTFSVQKYMSPSEFFPAVADLLAMWTDLLFSSEDVQSMLRSNDTKFDLLIYEGINPGLLAFKYHYNVPSIVMFTTPLFGAVHFLMGNPVNPSYIPSFVTSFSDKMTFFERLMNSYYFLYEIYIHNYYTCPKMDAVMKKHFGNDIPSSKELEMNNSLLLLSGDLSQSYPMPVQPNTIHVGTLHIKPNKPLPKDLQNFMDSAKDGVIYFSLGSNKKITSLSEETRNVFIKAFEQFPKVKVLMKWESDIEFPNKPANVCLKKWLPQRDILAHKNLKLFITHGGHQSRQEAVHYGLPLITIPFFYDQEWDAKKSFEEEAGLIINFDEVTYDKVYEALKELLTNDKYKRNMERLSAISKDKPMQNEETVAWWVEYVIRHKGAPHLRPAVQELYWFQYTLLDIIAFISIFLFLFVYFIYFDPHPNLHVINVNICYATLRKFESEIMFTTPLYGALHFIMGNPVNPSYIPSFVTTFSDKMTFFERLMNSYYLLYEIYIRYYYTYPKMDAVMKKHFGNDITSSRELEMDNSLLLLSGDLSQSYPMPVQPNTIHVGTLHIKPNKPLPKDLQNFMDNAKDGVIYFSLGSNKKIASLSEETRNAFVKAFEQFPKVKVLMKWESDIEFPNKPENKNIKLFITHGGHQSRQEAVHYGVPLISIPFFYDQEWDAKKSFEEEAGLIINFFEVTYDKVFYALKELLTNDKYKRNMERLSAISKDKPMANEETAAWWVEYVIRHKGAPHLRPAVQDLYWFQYTLLDIIAFISIFLFLFVYFIYFIVKKILFSSLYKIKIKSQ
ncbi:UDP-glycosyltransferase UGT5-like [Lycorma delicatula]|uniref:UDP-glycosyltransferase UGT5-like n=1 Tax=Lycorma delicatula TaxID=130591 RepID=UPI003F50DE00